MEWYEVIITIVAAVITLFGISWVVVSAIAKKIAKGAGTVETSMDSAALIAQGLGLEKISTILKEGADIPEEAEKIAEFIAEVTADGDFTKDEIMAAFKMFRDGLWVEMKDFRIKVFPKK